MTDSNRSLLQQQLMRGVRTPNLTGLLHPTVLSVAQVVALCYLARVIWTITFLFAYLSCFKLMPGCAAF